MKIFIEENKILVKVFKENFFMMNLDLMKQKLLAFKNKFYCTASDYKSLKKSFPLTGKLKDQAPLPNNLKRKFIFRCHKTRALFQKVI